MRKILLLFTLLLSGLAVQAQLSGSRWEKGVYHDKNGMRHEGFISGSTSNPTFGQSAKDIRFKKAKDAQEIKVHYSNIRDFIVYKKDGVIDSFTVSKRLGEQGQPFLLVMIDNSVKLYLSLVEGLQTTSTGASNVKKYIYYVGDSPNNATELTKKNFITMMSRVMEDKPEVVKRIEDKDFKKGDMEDLVFFYKNGVEKPSESSGAIDGKYY